MGPIRHGIKGSRRIEGRIGRRLQAIALAVVVIGGLSGGIGAAMSTVAPLPAAQAAANMTIEQFVNTYQGHYLDYPAGHGGAQYQCVDVFKAYDVHVIGGNGPATGGNGGADAYWNDFSADGLTSRYTQVAASQSALRGDVAVWGGGEDGLGHVAIVMSNAAASATSLNVLTQNPGPVQVKAIGKTYTYDGQKATLLGYLRPKTAVGFAFNTFGWKSMSYLGTDNLTDGHGLRANQYIMSQNGEFALELTGNGNLAEFGSSKPGELWNNNVYSGSLTSNTGGLDLQFDGNLVDYNGNGSPLWATGTSGRDDLVLQNDGNLVMYNSSGAPIWSDGAGGSFTASNTWTNTLVDGKSLPACAMLTSADGRFHLLEECNGDLYEYGPGNSPMWQSGTNSPGAVLALQGGDGNLVMYSTSGVPVWASGTGGNLGDDLAIQDDGNVVIYSSKGVPLWSTGT